MNPDPKIRRRKSRGHGLPAPIRNTPRKRGRWAFCISFIAGISDRGQPWGKRTCLTFAGNTTAMRLEERVAGHSWGAWELGFMRLFHRENFGSG
jgi:hypothetical protein